MSIPHENDQAHARRALNEAFEMQNRPSNGAGYIAKTASFCSNPAEYEWKYIGKREMLVPYDCKSVSLNAEDDTELHYPQSGSIRWELHFVWVVEGNLHKGESNVLALRRFYIDADSWLILLGEGYDRTGQMVNCYMLPKRVAAERADAGRWYAVVTTEPKTA
jgi:hypothetical protein